MTVSLVDRFLRINSLPVGSEQEFNFPRLLDMKNRLPHLSQFFLHISLKHTQHLLQYLGQNSNQNARPKSTASQLPGPFDTRPTIGTARAESRRLMTRRDPWSHAPNAPLVSRSQQRSSSTCHSTCHSRCPVITGVPQRRTSKRETQPWKRIAGRQSPPIRHRRPDAASCASKLSCSRRRSEIVVRCVGSIGTIVGGGTASS